MISADALAYFLRRFVVGEDVALVLGLEISNDLAPRAIRNFLFDDHRIAGARIGGAGPGGPDDRCRQRHEEDSSHNNVTGGFFGFEGRRSIITVREWWVK